MRGVAVFIPGELKMQIPVELIVNKDAYSILNYMIKTSKYKEKIVLKSPLLLMYFHKDNPQKLKENEKLIATDAYSSYNYARSTIKNEFKLGEEAISKSPIYSLLYSLYVIKRRFELGEEAISKNSVYSYRYAVEILKRRFELGEEIINKNNITSKLYNAYFKI